MGDDPGSDDEKSISWDDSKCVGISSWTPTSQTWIFRQEQEEKEEEVKKAEKRSKEDRTDKVRRGDNEKNAKKREAGFACQEEPRRLERESEEAEEESKSQEAEWMQPDNWSNQGMFGIIGEASQVWEEAKQRKKKKREKEEKARIKIEEERAKFRKLLKREKEEKERKIKKAGEDKERAKQLDATSSSLNNPEPDQEVSQSRFYHQLLMLLISGKTGLMWFKE